MKCNHDWEVVEDKPKFCDGGILKVAVRCNNCGSDGNMIYEYTDTEMVD